MAWRFKASKFKNSTPIVPKFEHLIRDLSIGSYHSHGNFIESSAAFMAFNWDVQVDIFSANFNESPYLNNRTYINIFSCDFAPSAIDVCPILAS